LNSKQIEKVDIPEKAKGPIREELKDLGISYSSLFPGMDGVCQDLNDKLVLNLNFDEIFS
jgi:hypothetical protein